MDIEINALSAFFLNVNLILSLYQPKVHITQPIEWGLEKPEQPIKEAGNFKFCAPINEWTLIRQKLLGKEKDCIKKEN